MGYSTAEVETFLEEMARLAEKSIRTEKELQDRVQALNEELVRWKGREAEIGKLREKAQNDAGQLRAEAERDASKTLAEVEERANEIRNRTEQWLEDVIAKVEETERRRTSFVTAFRSALDSHYALLKAEEEPSESLGAKLSEFLSGEAPPPAAN